jgi:hypothetical protein
MAEVAQSVGITLANAKTRVHRARLFLRKRLAAFMETTSVSDGLRPLTSPLVTAPDARGVHAAGPVDLASV